MYICICHAITEKDIQKEIAKGVSSMSRLSEVTMLGTQCGYCTEHASQVLSRCGNCGNKDS